MQNNKKLSITMFGLAFLIGIISVDAASQFGVRRFTGAMAPTFMKAVPFTMPQVVPTFDAFRFYSEGMLDKRSYSKKDIVKFPEFNLSHEEFVRSCNENAELFIPPVGKHYSHPRYNMNIYEKGKKIFGEDTVSEMETYKNENYLFPDINSPRIIKSFLSLPFSSSGSLWAYLSLQDYIDDNPCWSGSASLVTPYCAVTAAHCLISHETHNRQPVIYAFVLHHHGDLFTTKVKCLGHRVLKSWEDSAKKEEKPGHEEDFGIVFFKPISVKHGLLKMKLHEEVLMGKKVEITGYPGDNIALRARKIWPSNLDGDIGCFFPIVNKFPYIIRKFGYDMLHFLRYLEADKFAGCLMYSSPGKIIHEEGKMVSYDANTFSGQSGGNGVAEFQYTDSEEQDKDVILDFIHTLGGNNPEYGNMGVKIEGEVTQTILNWSHDAVNIIKAAQNARHLGSPKKEDTNEKKAAGELVGKIKVLVKYTKMTDEQILGKLKPEHKDITLDQIGKIRNPA